MGADNTKPSTMNTYTKPTGPRRTTLMIVMLGSCGSGKSFLARRFIEGHFDVYNFQIDFFDMFCKTISYKGQSCSVLIQTTQDVAIWGTKILKMFYTKADAVMVVYDITSQKSFERAKESVEELFDSRPPRLLHIAIVGTKVDLEKYREVKFQEGQEYANSIQAFFMETSAMTRENYVDEFFLSFCHEAFDISHPISFVENQYTLKSNEDFKAAMANGGGSLTHLNIILHGPPGSGKSSLKRVILGEDPLPEWLQNSTDIMENAVRAVSLDRIKQFAVVEKEYLIDLLAETMLQHIEEHQQTIKCDNQPIAVDNSLPDRENPDRENQSSPSQSNETMTTITSSITTDTPSTSHSTSAVPQAGSSNTCSLLRIRTRVRPDIRPSADFFDSKWHHLIDSGGQQQFQDILPLVYNSPAMQIILMRLTERLDQKPKMCYTEMGKNTIKNQHRLQLTNYQYIEKMCQIAVSSNPTSRVIVVGTHKDQLGENAEAKIEELNDGLVDIRRKYNDVLICKSDDEVIFDINTMATGKERKEYTQELQKVIEEVSEVLATTTPVPLQWLAFQLDISNVSGVVKVEDCYKSAKAIGMGEDTVKSALAYFNKAALLLYYPNDMPDLVLTKVDPLVSKLSELVKASFITPNRMLLAQCEEFRNTGVFHKSLLSDIFNTTQNSNVLSDDEFLKLLECLKIAVAVGDDDYFLPSALSFDIPPYEMLIQTSIPIGFSWDDRLLPYGFFFTVAVELLGVSSERDDLKFQLSKSNQWRDEIRFIEKSRKIPGIVKLSNRITWIQVSTSSPNDYCPIIFKAVVVAIRNAMKRFEYTGIKPPTVVYLCPLCPARTDAHCCILTPNKKTFSCSKVDSIVGSVTPEMSCWMEEPILTDEISVNEVDDTVLYGSKDLIAILRAIISVVNWHSLGLELPGLEQYQLDKIEIDNRGIVEDCQKAMVSEWLHTGVATWRGLVQALTSPLVNRRDLAVEIAIQHQRYDE